MRPVFVALKVDHTIYTSEGGAVASTAMGIEFFLGEHITAGLQIARQNQSVWFSFNIPYMNTHLALKRNHD